MQKSDFNFHLPNHLIAQTPAIPRDSSRLLCINRSTGALEHRVFNELPVLLNPGDVLVVNNSRVLPARLIGHKLGGTAVCEILLLRQRDGDNWECLAKPGKRLQNGSKVVFGDESLIATILETYPDGSKLVNFEYDTQTLYEKLDVFGRMPLPPYITHQLQNNADYQTVYAKTLGSAAAPTAGLHFTPELLQALRQRKIEIVELTLHVGLGTFRPVKEDVVENHAMHSEWYSLEAAAARTINDAKTRGNRVVAVGTTSCRTLESIASKYGKVQAASGDTDIFIYPGYTFKIIDGLVTNFHLPESTLIMLVSAFCGYENTMNAYNTAIENEYRFFSFGDAMLIL